MNLTSMTAAANALANSQLLAMTVSQHDSLQPVAANLATIQASCYGFRSFWLLHPSLSQHPLAASSQPLSMRVTLPSHPTSPSYSSIHRILFSFLLSRCNSNHYKTSINISVVQK